ncbi:MAG: metal-dependent transcriptional regulator [Chloroflexales bacterium]|nr:metal-dependent transcriptional regulator [Chloroflexales bacterium]
MADSPQAKPTSARKRHLSSSGPTEKEREYLEVIYYLAARREPVIAARLAKWMGVQPPTVSHIVVELLKKGYINRDMRSEITLTPEGFTLAEAMVRRHRILERFLVDVMRVPWDQIHAEAVRLEHALSPLMEARIEELVAGSRTCPHGNPIPGTGVGYPGSTRLDNAPVGSSFTMLRIVEEAEEDNDLMHFIQANNLIPGTTFTISDSSHAFGVTLQRDTQSITVSPEIASVLWGDVDEPRPPGAPRG